MKIKSLLNTTFNNASTTFAIPRSKSDLFYVVTVVGHYKGWVIGHPKVNVDYFHKVVVLPNSFSNNSNYGDEKNRLDIAIGAIKNILYSKYAFDQPIKLSFENGGIANGVNITINGITYLGDAEYRITQCSAISN